MQQLPTLNTLINLDLHPQIQSSQGHQRLLKYKQSN